MRSRFLRLLASRPGEMERTMPAGRAGFCWASRRSSLCRVSGVLGQNMTSILRLIMLKRAQVIDLDN